MKLCLSFVLIFLFSCSDQSNSKKNQEKKQSNENITWDSGTQILNDVANGGTELDFPTIQSSEGENINIPLRLGFKNTQDVQVFSLSLFDSNMSVPDTSCFSKTYSGEVTDPIYCDFIVNVASVEAGTKAYQMRLLIKEDNLFKSKYFTVYVSTEESPLASGGEVSYIGLTSEDPDQLDYGKLSSISQRTIRIKDEDSSDGSLLNIDYSQLTSFRITYDSCRSRSRNKCVLRISAPFPNPNGRDSDQYTESFFVNGEKVDLLAQYDAEEAEPPTDEEQTQVDNNTVTFEDIDELQYVTFTVKNETSEDWENIEVSDIPPFINKIYDSCDGQTLKPNKQCIIRLSFNASDYTGDDALGTMFVSALPYGIDIISIKKGDTIPDPGTVTFTHLDNIDLSTLSDSESVYVTDLNEASFNVKGTCSENDLDIEIFVNSTKLGDFDCQDNLFDFNLDLSDRLLVPEGLSSLIGMNFGGTSDLQYIIRDSSASIDLLEISDITNELENIKDLSGTCDLVDFGSIISLDLNNDGSIESTIACSNSGDFEFEDIDFSSFPNGLITVKVSYTDSAGNYAEDIETFNKNIISLIACTEAQAQANGYDISSYDQIIGQTDGSDISSCSISCQSGFTLDNFACTKACDESDAISNSVDTLNFLAIKGNVIGSDISQCLIDTCQSGYYVSGDEKSCISSTFACESSHAQANGYNVSLFDQITGQTDGIDVSGCSITCPSGYNLDNFACTKTCDESDATSNGVNISNYFSLKGNVVGTDVSQCLINSCQAGFDVSIDEKSCESQSLACTHSDAQSNGVDLLGILNIEGDVVSGDVSSCLIENCLSDFNLASDQKSCEEVFTDENKCSVEYYNSNPSTFGGLFPHLVMSNVKKVGVSNYKGIDKAERQAFAISILKNDGGVQTFGNDSAGGSQVEVQSFSGLSKVHANEDGFIAVKNHTQIKTWGGHPSNTSMSQTVIDSVFSGNTFAINDIVTNDNAAVALLENGTIKVWGDDLFGGKQSDADALIGSNKVIKVVSTFYGFSALLDNNTVVTWGYTDFGTDSQTPQRLASDAFNGNTSEILDIHSTRYAYAARLANDSVIAWGDILSGGDQTQVDSVFTGVTSGIKYIKGNDSAFAAVLKNGKLRVWGSVNRGGDQATVDSIEASNPNKKIIQLETTVDDIFFLYDDGTVAGLGGGNPTPTSDHLIYTNLINSYASNTSPVKSISVNSNELIALHEDSFVTYAWDNATSYNNEQPLIDSFNLKNHDLREVILIEDGFIGILKDGNLVRGAFTSYLNEMEIYLSLIGTDYTYNDRQCEVIECESGYSITNNGDEIPASCQ